MGREDKVKINLDVTIFLKTCDLNDYFVEFEYIMLCMVKTKNIFIGIGSVSDVDHTFFLVKFD